MNIQRTILERIVSASKNITATSEVRHFLTAVCLHSNERRELVVVATDGHKLVKSTFQPDQCDCLSEHLENKECLVFKDQVQALELLLKQNKRQQVFHAAIVPSPSGKSSMLQVSIAPTANVTQITLGEVKPSGEFPNYRPVVPDIGQGEWITIGLNAEYLMELRKAIADKSQGIKLHVKITRNGDTVDYKKDPIVVTYFGEQNGEPSAVLMPMRVD